jgi:hypothetical protein
MQVVQHLFYNLYMQVNYDGIFLVEDSPRPAEHETISSFRSLDEHARGAGLASLLSSSYEAEGASAFTSFTRWLVMIENIVRLLSPSMRPRVRTHP